jgi:RimJ/RimL family protein N-acetyltransferase
MLPELAQRRVLVEVADAATGRAIGAALAAEGFEAMICDGRGPGGRGCPLLLGVGCPLLDRAGAVLCGLGPGEIADAVRVVAPDRTEVLDLDGPAGALEAVRRVRGRRGRSVRRLIEVGGRRLLVRAATDRDAERLRAFDRALSERTRRLRYLSYMPPLTDEQVNRMAGVDFDHRFAFLALEGRGAARRVVADARLIDDPDHPGRAELAIAIADGLQGLGIGPLMVRLLIDVARERGLEAVGAEVWWEKQPMVRVLRRLGFERTAWDLGVMTFVLRLG